MTSFKSFFLEYFKGNPILRVEPNRKNPNRVITGKTKTATTLKKEEDYKDSLVKDVALGRVNNVIVPYNRLMLLLKKYDIRPEPGVKVLGNSKVQVKITLEKNGRLQGKLSRRENGV